MPSKIRDNKQTILYTKQPRNVDRKDAIFSACGLHSGIVSPCAWVVRSNPAMVCGASLINNSTHSLTIPTPLVSFWVRRNRLVSYETHDFIGHQFDYVGNYYAVPKGVIGSSMHYQKKPTRGSVTRLGDFIAI
jgi:hypothetical protein